MEKGEKIVYFVRHGESVANVSKVFQPPTSPLNEKGKEQAARIAERAKNIDFETLIASPWARAAETAQVIAQVTGKEPEFSELFVERVKPSSINGKSYEDEQANATWREWEESLYTSGARVEDGEGFDDLVARADKALDFLLARKEETMLVVTHGFFFRVMVAHILAGERLTGELHRSFQYAMAMKNTGLSVLRYHGGFEEPPRWRLWIYNDHAHLG